MKPKVLSFLAAPVPVGLAAIYAAWHGEPTAFYVMSALATCAIFVALCCVTMDAEDVPGDDIAARLAELEKKSMVPDAMEKVVKQVNDLTLEQQKVKESLAKLVTVGIYKGGG
jgi:hypothetical protein